MSGRWARLNRKEYTKNAKSSYLRVEGLSSVGKGGPGEHEERTIAASLI